MADTDQGASDLSWFAAPAAQAPAAPPAAETAAPGGSPGEKYGYHPASPLEAAPEAFPVAPQVLEAYSQVIGQINQGIADGSINGDDKQKFIDLSDKYADIWDQYAQRSHNEVADAQTAALQTLADDVKDIQANHPDLQHEVDAQSPSPDTLKDAVGLKADLIEGNLETQNTWTHSFLDGSQIILDFTREAAEIRSHQDGADTDSLAESQQKLDHLQTGIDDARDAADDHLDKNIDAVETWRDDSERFIDAIPHPNQTSEGFRDQAQVSVNLAGPDAAGQTVYEAQSVSVVALAESEEPHHEGVVATAAADADHGARDAPTADGSASPDTMGHGHDASASTAVEETSA